MIAVLLLMLAQDPVPRLICTSVNTPVYLGTNVSTVEMKCCPKGMYVADPDHPALDKKGNLICVEET